MTQPSDPSRPVRALSFWIAPLGVFLVALLVTAALLASLLRSIEARDRSAFESEVTRTTDAVRERIDTTITLLRGLAGLYAGGERVDRARFSAYAQQLQLRVRYPGVLGIGFSERIPAADLPHRLQALRELADPGFRVWPGEPRAEYHAIVHLAPLDERNQAAIGYDMYTDATRRAAMARARDSGLAAASGKVVLVQEIDADKQAGFLIYLPVYRGGGVPATLEARRRELLGFVYAPLRAGDLLQGVRVGGIRELDYELFDGGQAEAAALLRSTRDEAAPHPAFSATRQLEVAGRPWLLRFTTRPAFEAVSQRRLVPWLGVMALAASLLLAWITFVQARARREAEAAAAQRRQNELALQASEERARERAERLQQLYAELREGERRKDEFLAVLAHELRNPLAPIRNSLEVMRRAPDGPSARRAREIAERQLRHMVRLVDDLLDVSRISRGKIVLQREPVPLAQVLEAAVETSRPLIERRRHALQLPPVDPSLVLEIDPARVAQILTNLLNNAANYTPPDGRIELAVQAQPEEVRIAVRDNGIGIEPGQLARVFQLFVQVGQAPGGGGGLGIGLNLSARLAELHGGRIEAHSAGLGQGSEFVLVLPRDGTQPQAHPAAADALPP